jgi:hypothetical protein
MRNIQRVLISFLLIVGLTNCGSRSVESRKNELMVEKEVLIRSLASQLAWLSKVEKSFDVTPHQVNTCAELFLAGVCGILERKKVESSDVRAYARYFFSEVSKEWEGPPEFSRIFPSLLFGESDASEDISILLDFFLEEAMEIEKREAEKVCEAIINKARALLKVVGQIRELS